MEAYTHDFVVQFPTQHTSILPHSEHIGNFLLDEYIYQYIYRLIMTKSDAANFLPLKPNWFHILLSLAGGEQHGYGIMQDVLEQTTGRVRLWPATLYGAIK